MSMELETDHVVKRRLASQLAPLKRGPASSPTGEVAPRHGALSTPRSCHRSSSEIAAQFPAHAEIVEAHAGDHPLIHSLLLAAHQRPTHHDFISSLDEPSYTPSDRLLVKEGDKVVAHVQMLHRAAMFEQIRVPIGVLHDLAVLPELGAVGYDHWLLASAEEALGDSRAVVGVARAESPELYRAAGWSEARGRGYSRASVGDLLAHLAVPSAKRSSRTGELQIRLWRHVELEAVQAIYRHAIERHWGGVSRSERYWQWLVGRKAHSELIAAVDGPDMWDDLSQQSGIVGYAVTHGSQVIEICCLPEFPRAAPRLLERACQDAIERNYHMLSLHTPADDPLHELVVTAGGNWCADDRAMGGTLLLKLLDPERWIELLDPLLRQRTRQAGIARPCEIGCHIEGGRYRLQLTRRSSRLLRDDSSPGDVSGSRQAFSDLFLGNLHVGQAIESGCLSVASDEVAHKLNSLFPASFFWQSRFDTLGT